MPLILLASVFAAGVISGVTDTSAPVRLVLRAQAGLGGFVRPGRWTPLRVQIDNNSRDLKGEVLVEWGEMRLHRAIDIPAPSRTVIDLYVRTLDVRSSIGVRLIASGGTLASADIPIGVVADEELLVVCVGTEPKGPSGPPCTTTMLPEALPRSMRGYVAADEVRLQPGTESRLSRPQRMALHRWRAYRELEEQDLLTRAPQAPLTAAIPSGVGRATTIAAVMPIALLLASTFIWMRGRGSASRSYAAIAGASVLGVGVAVGAGRFGPGAHVLVRHSTTLQQVGDGAIVSMRGTIEYPTVGGYTMRVLGVDGDLTSRWTSTAEQWLDASGTPIRVGTFGRGTREEIEVHGVAEYAPFQVHREGDVVRVLNVSDATLIDCSFPQGFSVRLAGNLAPDQSASAYALAPTDAPFFSCVLPVPPVSFSEVSFPVRVEGAALVSVTLPERSSEEAIPE